MDSLSFTAHIYTPSIGSTALQASSFTALPWLSSSRWPLVGCFFRSSNRSAVVPEEALEVSRDALLSSFEQRSIEDPARFWSEIASQFYWKKRWNPEVYSENIDVRKGAIKIEWFKGGITNISYNALDRNIQAGNGDKVGIYLEGNEPGQDGQLTYSQLLDKVCQWNGLMQKIHNFSCTPTEALGSQIKGVVHNWGLYGICWNNIYVFI